MKTLVFDTETTGLPRHPESKLGIQPRVIEFGALLIDEDYKPLDSWSILINPGCKLEVKITKITGLTDEDLADKPPFESVVDQIITAFAQADCMAAHNLPFDMTLIELELRRLKVGGFPWPRFRLCTAQAYSQVYGYRPRMQDLYADVTGDSLHQTHRALDDCYALKTIIEEGRLIELATQPLSPTAR